MGADRAPSDPRPNDNTTSIKRVVMTTATMDMGTEMGMAMAMVTIRVMADSTTR